MAERRDALTCKEIREIDRKAIEEYEIPGMVLMENAGRNVAEEILKMLDEPQNARVTLFCGKGNNGGDGFVIARHLYNRNVNIYVYLTTGIANALSDDDAGRNLKILLNMNIEVKELQQIENIEGAEKDLLESDVIVDAIFGTGLKGEVREPVKTLIKKVNASNVPTVSVDIPSGLHGDEGTELGVAVRATKTVTFVAPKVGFFQNRGRECTGEVIVTDICVPKELKKLFRENK